MKSGGLSKIEGNDTPEGKKAIILGTGNIGRKTAKKLKFRWHASSICTAKCGKLTFVDS